AMNRRRRLDQELRDHLERRAAELREQGLSAAAAERQATVEFGGLEPVAQQVREGWRLRWLLEAGVDARLALRSWRRSPGFAITALLILALGIGANLVTFGVLQATLLRPLPYPRDRQLVYLTEVDNHGADQSFSMPDLRDFQAQVAGFSAMGGYRNLGVTLPGGADGAELVAGRIMTAGMFEALGVRPLLGRWFTPQEHQANGAPVAIISYGLWQSRFGGDRGVVGKMLETSAGARTIVGVMPADFAFGAGTAVYAPYEQLVPASYFTDRANSFILYGVGRLRAGMSLEGVRAQVAAVSARLAQQYPKSNATVHATAVPLRAQLTGSVGPSLWMLFAAVGVLLLIVAVNLANLLLARAAGRGQEMAVRTTLGASRGRLARQLLAEGLL
ncbi:MAG: ABC transporter permease, partial [Terriglobales bacterium]